MRYGGYRESEKAGEEDSNDTKNPLLDDRTIGSTNRANTLGKTETNRQPKRAFI
jgi:hypothetical protein